MSGLCSGAWRGDDGELHLCDLPRGHSSECICYCAKRWCETVEMIPPVVCTDHGGAA